MLISFALASSSCEAREESENYKMKYSYNLLFSLCLFCMLKSQIDINVICL